MGRLYFRYGVMGCGKSMNLLAVADNYENQNFLCFTFKPAVDNRGEDRNSERPEVGQIISRTGLRKFCNLVYPEDNIQTMIKNLCESMKGYDDRELKCVLVDEAQFLTVAQVEQLRKVSIHECPVICYGLKTDFRTHLFEGSKRLLELSDKIEEMKTVCHKCGKKAILNVKVGGSDNVVEIGGDDLYLPVCAECYENFQKSVK